MGAGGEGTASTSPLKTRPHPPFGGLPPFTGEEGACGSVTNYGSAIVCSEVLPASATTITAEVSSTLSSWVTPLSSPMVV